MIQFLQKEDIVALEAAFPGSVQWIKDRARDAALKYYEELSAKRALGEHEAAFYEELKPPRLLRLGHRNACSFPNPVPRET